MKKLMALVLALVLALGMATVAFADLIANPGKTYNIQLELADGVKISDLRVKTDFSEGKSAVKVTLDTNDLGDPIIKFVFAENFDVKNTKWEGTVTITDKYGKPAVNQVLDWTVSSDGMELDPYVDFTDFDEAVLTILPGAEIGWDAGIDVDWTELNEELWPADADDVVPTVVNFKKEVEKMQLKLDGIDAQIDFKMFEQGKVNLAFNTVPDKALMTANPDADISALNFLAKPTLDFVGDLKFFGEKDKTFVYLYNDGKLTDAKAEWSEDDQAYIVKTNKLSSYVVSNIKLEAASAADGDKDNPGMGANNIISVMVVASLAVVSSGVAVLKH